MSRPTGNQTPGKIKKASQVVTFSLVFFLGSKGTHNLAQFRLTASTKVWNCVCSPLQARPMDAADGLAFVERNMENPQWYPSAVLLPYVHRHWSGHTITSPPASKAATPHFPTASLRTQLSTSWLITICKSWKTRPVKHRILSKYTNMTLQIAFRTVPRSASYICLDHICATRQKDVPVTRKTDQQRSEPKFHWRSTPRPTHLSQHIHH